MATLRVAWYRFHRTFERRWGGYVALAVVIGFVGGVALGAIAMARRTQSSFPEFVASTHPRDAGGITAVRNADTGSAGYDAALIDRIAHVPHVRRVASSTGLNILPLGADGAPGTIEPVAPGNGSGSVDGAYFDMDRPVVVAGRMADPNRAGEFVTTAKNAELLGWRIGDVIPMGVYTNEQTSLPGFGTTSVGPHIRIDVQLVGLVITSDAVVQDDVDASQSSLVQIFTPALTRPLLDCCVNYTATGVQLDQRINMATVLTQIAQLLPAGFPPFDDPVAPVEAKAQRAIRPEVIAVDVFGAIAALVVVLIAAQMIGRQIRSDSDERDILRALGAGPWTTSMESLIGIVAAVIVGSLLAVTVAVGLSPLAPLGPVRAVLARHGFTFDWMALGVGGLGLIVTVGSAALVLALWRAPHRVAARHQKRQPGVPIRSRAAAASGMPVPAVTGIRFALDADAGRSAVPVRSAILGATLAVIVVTASLTFGASLNRLVSRPALYGWNWDLELSAGGNSSDIPHDEAAMLLDHDPDLQAWTGVYFAAVRLDGHAVPAMAMTPGADIGPPLLSGHAVQAADQIVLGAKTLAQLHKRIGDHVDVDTGGGPPVPLRIVGTATMPTMGVSGLGHLQLGSGALLSDSTLPANVKNAFNNPSPGPNGIFLRFRPGVDRVAATTRLRQISHTLSTPANFGVDLVSVQRPAEIVNYQTMGTTPALLGAGLGLGAVGALGLTLVASVRRRRQDLALLKALGFTRRQLRAVVLCQSTVAVLIGAIVGAPLGIAAGRSLWTIFAQGIDAAPEPAVPTWSLLLVVVGALVLACLVALPPARAAARTPTAVLLRTQ